MGKTDLYLDNSDRYIRENSLNLTECQRNLIEKTRKLKEAVMLSSPDQIEFLANVCRMMRAKKTLDIGVFTGYSALTIAMSLPEDGELFACDVNQEFADVGLPFWKQAQVDHKIKLRIAPALTTLQNLIDTGHSASFDFAFVDAIKDEYHSYYELLLKLVKKGGLIAFDNMFGFGHCLDKDDHGEIAECLRKLSLQLKDDPRIHYSLLNVGDGTGLAFVN